MAYKYPRFLLHTHERNSIPERLIKNKEKSSIQDFVYGANDGIITTFAIVAGVSGAELSKTTILILGLSNIVADGFSMAASNYLGTQSEQDEMKLIHKFEENQVQTGPEGEIEEIRQIFKLKGFHGELLERLVQFVTEDKNRWVNMMLMEEYGFPLRKRHPMKAALATFSAFILFGLIPLLPFILNFQNDFIFTTIFTGLAFFTLGSLKSRWSLERFWVSGFKTFLIGSLAAGFAYFIGVFLKDLG